MTLSLRAGAPSRVLIFATSLLALGCCKKKEPARTPAAEAAPPAAPAAVTPIARDMLGVFAALPASFDSKANPSTKAKVALGRLLYFDKRLSKAGDIACNSCHKLDAFGVDGEPTSPGHKGQRGGRNSPTVFNAAGHLAQFWDGRAPDVEAQAKGPVTNPIEMAMPDADAVEAVLKGIPGYVAAFATAFPDDGAPGFDNMAKAIAAFERKLITPAPWDAFLGGDDQALTDKQKKGARVFVETGCQACHNGPLLGGNSYQKVGQVKPWPELKDEGRGKITGKDADKHVFKVPSLRNVAKTGPYFHDGGTADLGEAVKLMARHQLGKELDDTQVAYLLAFLDALTGTPPAGLVATPDLPPAAARPAAEPPSPPTGG